MSQKKMDAYKYAKKNQKEIEKKQKRKRIISWTCGTLVTLILIAGCTFLIYYTNVLKPKNDAAKAAASVSENAVADDVANIINGNQDGDTTAVPATDESGSPVIDASSLDAGSEETATEADTDAPADAATDAPVDADTDAPTESAE